MTAQHGSDERWLPVLGFEGFYEVSNRGRVRSLPRSFIDKLGRPWRNSGRILTPCKRTGRRSGAYLAVKLCRQGTRPVCRLVHSLELEAFNGPRPEGMVCRHDDNDGSNDDLTNIAWGTSSENTLDTIRHGTHNQASKEVCPAQHLLIAPNLIPSNLKNNNRACLACSRARSNCASALRRGVELDFRAVAAEHYRKIMDNVRTRSRE